MGEREFQYHYGIFRAEDNLSLTGGSGTSISTRDVLTRVQKQIDEVEERGTKIGSVFVSIIKKQSNKGGAA